MALRVVQRKPRVLHADGVQDVHLVHLLRDEPLRREMLPQKPQRLRTHGRTRKKRQNDHLLPSTAPLSTERHRTQVIVVCLLLLPTIIDFHAYNRNKN